MPLIKFRGLAATMLVVSFTVALVVVPAPQVASATDASASAVAADEWAWAVVRRPTTPSYSITGKDRASSSGGGVVVDRLAKGRWVVAFNGMAPSKGNAQVTALTSGAALCVVKAWGLRGTTLVVSVRCFKRTGAAKDVAFSVSFLEVNTDARRVGYVFADDPGSSSYTPVEAYQFNASGATNTIRRFNAGVYEISMPGLSGRGTAVVTPYGSTAVACQVPSLFPTSEGIILRVRCRDQDGKRVDSRFSALFLWGAGLKGSGGKSWAYLIANRRDKASYVPIGRRAQRPKGKPRVTRARKGVYTVKLPRMPLGGAVHVTAVTKARSSARCNASAIRRSGKPQRIGVRCFTGQGTKPIDAVFYLSFVR